MMTIKETKAHDYCENQPLTSNKYQLSEEAFKAGWEAALSHLSHLPVDEILKHLENNFSDIRK